MSPCAAVQNAAGATGVAGGHTAEAGGGFRGVRRKEKLSGAKVPQGFQGGFVPAADVERFQLQGPAKLGKAQARLNPEYVLSVFHPAQTEDTVHANEGTSAFTLLVMQGGQVVRTVT